MLLPPFGRLLASALLIVFACLSSAHAAFLPVVQESTLQDQTLRPGGTSSLTLKLFNHGDTGSLFAASFDVELRKRGTTENTGVGNAEPYPPTTQWKSSELVTLGIPLLLPPTIPPGEYDVFLVARTKLGRQIVPLALGGKDQTAADTVAVGHVTVTDAASPSKPATTTFCPPPKAAESLALPEKTESIVLANSALSVALGKSAPVVQRFGSETPLQQPAGSVPEFLLYQKSSGQWLSSASSPQVAARYTSRVENSRVVYETEITHNGQSAARCDLVISLSGSELRIGFQQVRESDDYLFMQVTWPRVLEASGSGARLATGRFGGRLLDPARCLPAMVTHEDTWYDSFPGALLYNSRTLAAIQTVSPGDTILSSVSDLGQPTAGIGFNLVHRIGSPGSEWKRWILAGDSGMVRLRALTSAGPALTWMDGIRMLRKDISDVRPPEFYRDSVLYKVLLDIKGYPGIPDEKPVTSYKDAKLILQQIQRLTDGLHQIAYLTGAQHEGQDTGYPDMFTINPQVGTYDELIDFMNSGPEQNATISFHSVLNEIYKESPMWDEEIVCRNPLGELAVYTTHFVGGVNYSINYPFFLTHGLQTFLDRLLAMYPIPPTYHIDVLSTRAHNLDFNPAHPCGPISGYFGRLGMLGSFNLRGVDVTSEGMTSWFVGKIGHAWLLRIDPFVSIVGEEQIPLSAMLFHGHATYGYPSELNPLIGLLHGATFSLDLVPLDRMTYHWKGNSIEDSLYLINFPYQMLRDREIQSYERKGDTRRVQYDDDTYVEVTLSDEQTRPFQGYDEKDLGAFRVVIDGRKVAENFTAFVPSPSGEAYLAYSRRGGAVTYPAPSGWAAGKKILCKPLEREPSAQAPSASAAMNDREITLTLPAGVPVRVSQIP